MMEQNELTLLSSVTGCLRNGGKSVDVLGRLTLENLGGRAKDLGPGLKRQASLECSYGVSVMNRGK